MAVPHIQRKNHRNDPPIHVQRNKQRPREGEILVKAAQLDWRRVEEAGWCG